jgi:hypothetical protein
MVSLHPLHPPPLQSPPPSRMLTHPSRRVRRIAVVSMIFAVLGAAHIQFFTFGPSPDTMLMGYAIDTWGKWFVVSCLTFINTVFTEYVYDCLVPWIMTTVIDDKGSEIPYSKKSMMYFVVVCSTYRALIQIVMIYIMLSQIDFLMIRLAADILVTVVTTKHFLRNKQYNPLKTRIPVVVHDDGCKSDVCVTTRDDSTGRKSFDGLLDQQNFRE